MDVNAIKKANPDIHNPNNLQVGKVINLPSAAEGPVNNNPHMQQHKVKQGNTLYLIARQYKVSDDDIKKANPGIDPENLQVGKVINIPSAAGGPVNTNPHLQQHKVKQGDTLYLIARQYKVSDDDIKKANPGIDPGNLPVGKELKIPNVKVQNVVPIHGKTFRNCSAT